jgi:preprotein translocase subunit SecE
VARKQQQMAEEKKEPKSGREQSRNRSAKKAAAPRKSAKSSNKVIRYFQDTRDELRKVSWPSRQDTIRLTLIVLAGTTIFAIFLGLFDLLFQQLAGLLVT